MSITFPFSKTNLIEPARIIKRIEGKIPKTPLKKYLAPSLNGTFKTSSEIIVPNKKIKAIIGIDSPLKASINEPKTDERIIATSKVINSVAYTFNVNIHNQLPVLFFHSDQ